MGRIASRRGFVALTLAVAVLAAVAPPAHAEINPGRASSFPDWLVNLNGTVLFSAFDPVHGTELWKSDGTTTSLVKDINPGECGQFGPDSSPNQLTVFGGKVYFGACDGVHGFEPWVSDGTESGTQLLMDVNPGSADSFPYSFTAVGSHLFFGATDATNGTELWETDGTTTALVQDIFPGSEGSDPSDLTAFGTKLFFSADDGVDGIEPWTTDGTTTTLLKNIRPLDKSSGPFFSTDVVGSKLLFFARDSDSSFSLYSTDGSPGDATVIQSDIFPTQIVTVGSFAYFGLDFGGLVKTDGTPGNTTTFSTANVVGDLTAVGSTLYFLGFDFVHGVEPWKSDGTEAGTVLVKDIKKGGGSSIGFFDTGMAAFNGDVFFAANDGAHGTELWRSDGTTAGTVLVKDINKNRKHKASSDPVLLTPAGAEMFFAANDGQHGFELWKSDGTRPGTLLVP